jgi:hypothetical protein
MTAADDTAAANAVGSGDEATARSSLGKLQTDNCTAVAPVIHELDPSIPIPGGC